GAAAGRSPALDDAGRADHAAHRGPPPLSGRAPPRGAARQRSPVRLGPAAPERRRQVALVLKVEGGLDGPPRGSPDLLRDVRSASGPRSRSAPRPPPGSGARARGRAARATPPSRAPAPS